MRELHAALAAAGVRAVLVVPPVKAASKKKGSRAPSAQAAPEMPPARPMTGRTGSVASWTGQGAPLSGTHTNTTLSLPAERLEVRTVFTIYQEQCLVSISSEEGLDDVGVRCCAPEQWVTKACHVRQLCARTGGRPRRVPREPAAAGTVDACGETATGAAGLLEFFVAGCDCRRLVQRS